MAQKKKIVAKAKATKPVATPNATKKLVRPAVAAKPAAARPSSAKTSTPKPVPVSQAAAKIAAVPVKAKAKAVPVPAASVKAAGKPVPAVQVKAASAPKPAAAKPAVAAKQLQATKAPVNAFVAHRAAAAIAAAPARPAPAALAKVSAGQKITAPVAPASPKAIAEKAAAAARQLLASKKPVSQRHGFKTNEFVVYPAHGVGRIVGIEEQEIAGMSLELFVINFDKEKLTLRVPTGKLESVGMRKLADDSLVKRAMEILKGRARVKRTMWSRRAQEYVAKINSGDLVSIAEVVRDLYRSEAQPEQSYSERQLYEDALDRMAREIAAVEKLDDRGAVQRITEVLSKSARGRRLAEETEAAETKAA
jgi:CarD family transcriptional regulator